MPRTNCVSAAVPGLPPASLDEQLGPVIRNIDEENAVYRSASEARALAQALLTVVEANDLNSNKHPTWMLADMLVEKLLVLEERVSP